MNSDMRDARPILDEEMEDVAKKIRKREAAIERGDENLPPDVSERSRNFRELEDCPEFGIGSLTFSPGWFNNGHEVSLD